MHRRGEGEPREDRHLGRRVAAGDVVGRIGLGVAELLGLPQRIVVAEAAALHLGEDVVGRPVDDAVDALHARRSQRFLEHPDHRHDPGHRALEPQLDVVLACARPQLLAVLGEQQLVRRHDVAAGLHRAQHVVARRIDAADQLDDQVRALQHLLERAPRAGEDPGDLGPHAGDRHERVRAIGEQLLERRADGAVPEQADPKGLWHGGRRRSRGGRRRARRRPSRRSPAGAARRCSCWPSRARTHP